jgi:single-stranded-DNA-specific exonuclease
VTTKTTWKCFPEQSSLAKKIGDTLNCSPIIGQLMLNRSIATIQQAQHFLARSWDTWTPLPNQTLFMDHINQIIEQNIPTCVYGDYDADGVTSTAMMVSILRNAGCTVDFISPHRFNDGYGLNEHRMRDIAIKKYGALLTLDCGISNHKEIALLKSLRPSIKVLILDHHKCPKTLPDADAIVNPQLAAPEHPARHLCTAALVDYVFRTTPISGIEVDCYADLVAIGLVSDVMPLMDLNRWYVHRGIQAIREHPSPCILELCIRAKVNHKEFTTRDIGFGLGPRLNAAGRLGDPAPVVRLLLETDVYKIAEQITALEKLNTKRKTIGESIQKDIEKNIPSISDFDSNCGIICAGELWHMGVIGINAARLVNKYHKPAIVIGFEGDIARGSARSVPEVNIYNIISKCAHILDHFGGHSQAAGFSLKPTNISAFKAAFMEACNTSINAQHLLPVITIDTPISLAEISLDFIEGLSQLEPFGEGNPAPVFMATATLLEARKVGKTQAHLKCRFEQNGHIIDGIGFNLAPKLANLSSHRVRIAFTVSKNAFNGIISPQLELIDIQ